jgi:hypothetical protein
MSTTQALSIRLSVLAVTASLSGLSCQSPEGTSDAVPPPVDPAPVIGRLQLPDRVVDLTVNAFSDVPGGVVPTGSYARVIADIIVDERKSPLEERTQSALPSFDAAGSFEGRRRGP